MDFEDSKPIVIIAIILLLIVGGFFTYKYYTLNNSQDIELNNAFSLGYNKSLIDVAQGQAQTGTIILWVNETIKVISLENVCGVLK
jgi:hypothetical protein